MSNQKMNFFKKFFCCICLSFTFELNNFALYLFKKRYKKTASRERKEVVHRLPIYLQQGGFLKSEGVRIKEKGE